ncbi:unnamed protein product [Mytilus coruscus]|uniref:Formin GTPase-binding domain-containing protein n=1 Tax=Mytilus coruscus TaxID=42192 RepID=A0A6J8BBU7_MYTCO|nr:unnamed protein product [Mytilus coruscus]
MDCFRLCCGKFQCLRREKENNELHTTVSMDTRVAKSDLDLYTTATIQISHDIGNEDTILEKGDTVMEKDDVELSDVSQSVKFKDEEQVKDSASEEDVIIELRKDNYTEKGGAREKGKFKKLVTGAFVNPAFDNCEPELCIEMMKHPSMRTFVALKKQLQHSDSHWISSFLEAGGLLVLLEFIDSVSTRRVCQLSDALVLLEAVQCVKAVINCKVGLEYLIQNIEFTKKLINSKNLFS